MAPAKLADISRPGAAGLDPITASITDVEHLASYSWIETSAPTIAIPGAPPRWTPPPGRQTVSKDSGLIYIAQNAARHPESPLEPLFRALYAARPSFDFGPVDLVTDRNNIRKLLAFINPDLSRNGREPFAIDVEVAEGTVIFCRTETETSMFIRPHEFRGFGHEFEKRYTSDEVGDSTGHHRITSYRFGGLKLMVRYETDGYVEYAKSNVSSPKNKKATTTTRTESAGNNDLSGMMESLSLHAPKRAAPASAESNLLIQEAGHAVPMDSTLEIKTRVAHKRIDIQEVIPQLWASQTPNLVRAYHRHGVFENPQVEDVVDEITAWEEDHQEDLARLAALIKRIIKAAKESDSGNVVVRYDGGEKLGIWEGDGGRMLPDDLYVKLGDAVDETEGTNSSELSDDNTGN